jgi:hypothetical protein
VNFDGKVRTTQLALHALDALFQILDRNDKTLHFQNLGRAELHTNMAALAILLNDLNSWQLLFI